MPQKRMKDMPRRQQQAAGANMHNPRPDRARKRRRTKPAQEREASKKPHEMTFEEFKEAKLTEKAGGANMHNPWLNTKPEVKTTEQSGMQTRPHGCPDRIWRMLALGGCLAIVPHCPIIIGVIKVYRIYKSEIENKNELNKNDSKEILKIVSSDLGTRLSKNQIEDYSNAIVRVIDSNGLVSRISNETNLSKNTIHDMIQGTTSNLLEKGIGTATGFTINILG